MSARREFLKKVIGVGAVAGTSFEALAWIEDAQDLDDGVWQRPYERLVAEIRMSPRVRKMAREDPKVRDMLIEDATRMLRDAMDHDDGTYAKII